MQVNWLGTFGIGYSYFAIFYHRLSLFAVAKILQKFKNNRYVEGALSGLRLLSLV